jgi:hypothetical protein
MSRFYFGIRNECNLFHKKNRKFSNPNICDFIFKKTNITSTENKYN